MKRISRRTLLLVGLAVLLFALGYRLPWFDRHPDWLQFPNLTNPRLVVEEIPAFDSIYGRRFPFTRKGDGQYPMMTATALICTRYAY